MLYSKVAQLKFLIILTLLWSGSATARQSIAIVAAANSDIPNLSEAQVKDLFLSTLEFLPNGSKAIVVDQTQNEAIMPTFYSRIANMTLRELTVYRAKIVFSGRGMQPMRVEGGDRAVKQWVISKQNGIGYIASTSVDAAVKVLLTLDAP